MTGIFGRRIYETWNVLNEYLDSGYIDLSNYVGAEMPLTEFERGLKESSSLTGRVIFYP